MPKRPINPILEAVQDATAWSNGQHESHGQHHPPRPVMPPKGNATDD